MKYDDLIVEDVEKEFEIDEGETKSMKWKISNNGRFIVRKFDIKPIIINVDTGKQVRKSYIKSTSTPPTFLLPDTSFVYKVELQMPENYKEISIIGGKEDLAILDAKLEINFKVFVARGYKSGSD